MELLGVADGITAEGHLLVPCAGVPDIGAAVFDGRRRRVGTVKRILGPVDAPYASVVPDGTGAPGLKGVQLFFDGSGQDGKAKRRNRRD